MTTLDALDTWENDGGRVMPPLLDAAMRSRTLPPGYSAQPAWAFRDPTKRFLYEFRRVFGPAKVADRDPYLVTAPLDKALSYWIVIWAEGTGDEERAACRSMSYGEAKRQLGARFSFDDFSSLVGMRDELPRLLLSEPPSVERRRTEASVRAPARALLEQPV